MTEIPGTIEVGGRRWAIRRAWPASRGRTAVEAEHEGRLRSGFLEDGRVTVLPAGEDPRLPGLAHCLSGPGNRLISHRPGKRAVVRLSDGTFAKCVRTGAARAVVDGTLSAAPFAAGFRMPEVIRVDDSTVVLSPLAGVGLHDPSPFSDEEWTRAWAEVLDAWARVGSDRATGTQQETGEDVGSMDPTRPRHLTPVHSAKDEIRVLREWRDRAQSFLEPLLDGPRFESLERGIAAVEAELSTSAGLWGPLHRDLHDKQLMWDSEHGPGLLDVDTACVGERELDLGNLRAHAWWRHRQGIWSQPHADAVVHAIATATSATGADVARVGVYERAALLRLVCVYVFRPRWRALIGDLIDAC
ncbi:phosphotransferase [Brevibacterium sp.]|uniref:phosphotransferase n=1 Tax=Brevibacterium sp. TaxID=1701 RepID=UPI002811D352|nr:phosphotransferase [Brevibacterium sp.]